MTLLQKIGHDFLKVLGYIEEGAEIAEPIIDMAVPGIALIYNASVSFLQTAMAAAAANSATTLTPAQIAAIATTMEPYVIPYLTTLGVSNPTSAQVQAYLNSVIQGLEIWETLQTVPKATVTTTTIPAEPTSTITVTEVK